MFRLGHSGCKALCFPQRTSALKLISYSRAISYASNQLQVRRRNVNVARTSHEEELYAHGFVSFRGASSPCDAGSLLRLLWDDYAQRHGVVYDEPKSWQSKNTKELRLYGKLPPSFRNAPEYTRLLSKVHQLSDTIFGDGMYRSVGKNILFVNCPLRNGEWKKPSGWHTDVDFVTTRSRPSFLYVFAFLDLLESHGGATFLLAGSTKRAKGLADKIPQGGDALIQALSSEDHRLKALLANSGHDEWDPSLLDPGIVSGNVPLRLVELTGSPGDVVFWDPRGLHTASSNSRSRPRSVVRFRLEYQALPPTE